MKALVRISLKYGVIAGVIGSILLVGLYYMDRHPFLIPVFLDFRIILFSVFIYFTFKEIRDFHQGGIFYFWQGIFSSFILTTCFAILTSLLIVVFIRIDPAFLSAYISLSIEQLKSLPPELIENIGKDVYNRNLGLLPDTNGSDLAKLYFWQSFMISLFISIILSVILRTQLKS